MEKIFGREMIVMKKILNYLVALLMLISLSAFDGGANQARAEDVRQRIAASYGIDWFEKVEQIQYTFNVKLGDKGVSRFWIWQPKVDKVTFKAGNRDEYLTYYREEVNETTSDRIKKIDAWFINDNYWLLFPYRIAWDGRVKVEDIGSQALPMGGGRAKCVVVSFPSTGGYTPGDIYELFLDNEYKLTHWVYRRGGSPQPTRMTTWEDHRSVGPLTLSLTHQGKDESFRLWFTNVGVKMAGAAGWMTAD
jgi:hypothetical protein